MVGQSAKKRQNLVTLYPTGTCLEVSCTLKFDRNCSNLGQVSRQTFLVLQHVFRRNCLAYQYSRIGHFLHCIISHYLSLSRYIFAPLQIINIQVFPRLHFFTIFSLVFLFFFLCQEGSSFIFSVPENKKKCLVTKS